MQKFHVKKGDTVLVITGVHKGKEAKIAAILPKKERVVLDGISSGKMKTVKRTQENQGGLVERSVSTHISNVKKIDAPVEKKEEAPKPKSKKSADGDKK